jgi:uncharacterized protein
MSDDRPVIRVAPRHHTGLGVLTIAGSSGRLDADRARLFARYGALAESVQWFGREQGPCEIPIELFQQRVADLRRTCDRILLAGTSFGSEAVMLTGGADAVVAFAPSDVVWAGIRPDGSQTSHWTVGGSPLPFAPFRDDWHPDSDPPRFRDLYELSRADAPEAAAIPAERIPHLILVAGGDDQVWPSVDQARSLAERRDRHGLPTTLVLDPEAGHRTILPGEPVPTGGTNMARGGTPAADRRLGAAAWTHIRRLMAGLATSTAADGSDPSNANASALGDPGAAR